MRKPVQNYGFECLSEDYDDMGGGAFCVQGVDVTLYTAKEVRRAIAWLTQAEKWIANKELYKRRGPTPKGEGSGGE